MIAGTAIRIVSDTATPALREWMAALTPDRLAARIGPPLQKLTMEHLAGLGSNVKGWPSTGFFEKFARNVRWVPDEQGVAVAILPAIVNGRTVGLRRVVFGGDPITPQTVSMLAIPISPVSYGHVPSDFPNLFLVKTVKGAYLCQRGEAVSEKTGHVIGQRRGLGGNVGRRIRAHLNFLFKLAASVNPPGNRDVLPSDEELLNVALTAASGGLN
jgi:hypothetical protein